MKKILSVILTAFFTVSMAFGITITDELKDMANQLVQTKATGSKPSYAFVSFTTDYKNTLIDDYITDALIEAMFKTGKVKIVERSNLEAILKEQKFQASGLVNEETAKSIGMIAGVDFVCYGTLKDLDYSFTVNARVVDVETGELCAIARATVTKDDYLKKQPQKALGTHSYATMMATKTTDTTSKTTVNTENNAWEVEKHTNESDGYTEYIFTVKTTDDKKLLLYYQKCKNPVHSKVISGIYGWGTGTYDIKIQKETIQKYMNSTWRSFLKVSNGDYQLWDWNPSLGARWLVDILINNDIVTLRKGDISRKFYTAGLLDKMAEYDITWEEIDAALANEEF